MLYGSASPRGVLAVLGGLLSGTASAVDVQVQPAPPLWVEVQEVPPPTELAGERVDVQYLLEDQQLQTDGRERELYRRRARRVGSVAGVERISQLSFDFDPAYERLVLHHVRILRDGEVHDALRAEDLQVVQQERELDRRIYNGVRSALAFLHDVRVGDVVDYAWTVQGSNPAFEGQVVHHLSLGWSVPIGRLHRRVRTSSDLPVTAHLQAGAPEPEVRRDSAWTEHRWTLDAVAGLKVEEDAPPDHEALPWAQVTSFPTWGDVVRWSLPHYRPRPPGPELAELARSFRDAGSTEEARARAALRFVQDEVRYLGIEVGPRGWIPHEPDEVLARRFGDCKDKAVLLVTLLRALDIEAWPALVSVKRRAGIEQLAPSPYAFDHVIVHAVVDGTPVWLDATETLRRGPVTSMPSRLGAALVLSPERSGLDEIPSPTLDEVQKEVTERYVVTELNGPVDLEVTTVYRGWEASRIRRTFAGRSADDIGEDYRSWYGKRLPGLQATAPLTVEDDEEADEVQVVERYRADRLWKDGARRLDGWLVADHLSHPDDDERSAPLSLSHPTRLRHVVEVQLPQAFVLDNDETRVRTDAFSFTRSVRYSRNVLSLVHTYDSHRDRVDPDALAAHRDAVEQASRATRYRLRRDDVYPGLSDEARGALIAAGLLGLFLVGPTLLRTGRRAAHRLAVRRQLASGEGATPDRSIQVRDTAAAVTLLAQSRCPCGGHPDADRRQASDLRPGGRHVLRLEAPCGGCGEAVVRYFRFWG